MCYSSNDGPLRESLLTGVVDGWLDQHWSERTDVERSLRSLDHPLVTKTVCSVYTDVRESKATQSIIYNSIYVQSFDTTLGF